MTHSGQIDQEQATDQEGTGNSEKEIGHEGMTTVSAHVWEQILSSMETLRRDKNR